MLELAGRLHPLVVHLPIGILLLAILFEWLWHDKKFKSLRKSVTLTLLLGTISAVVSVITGLALSQSGDYETDAVLSHQWAGIVLTTVSSIYAYLRYKKKFSDWYRPLSVLLLVLIILTGHLGGSLTHGEDFLKVGFIQSRYDLSKVDLQQADFYTDLVKPVLKDKCYGCHGPSKQKGKLRLDDPEHIMKGGKGGVVLVAGKTQESEMLQRMLLPLDHDDHMPPKEKRQPTPQQIEILKLWITTGASFDQSVAASGQLISLQKMMSQGAEASQGELPEKSAAKADTEVINQLRKLNTVVLPVAANSNYLSANLINVSSLDNAVDLLSKLKEQLVWLKAGNQPVQDTHLQKIAALTNLTRLGLEHTHITDEGLKYLTSLKNLHYLNLNYTNITPEGIGHLSGLKQLRSLYVYSTRINADQVSGFNRKLPGTYVEAGRYEVPTFDTDTLMVKASN